MLLNFVSLIHCNVLPFVVVCSKVHAKALRWQDGVARGLTVIERIAERQYVSDREWLYEKARLRGNLEPEEVDAIVQQTPVLEEQFEEKEVK